MEVTRLISVVIFMLLITVGSCTNPHHRTRRTREPCKRLAFYFHDIVYNGQNSNNATAAIVGAPAWANKTTLAVQSHFGDVVVFDDPITLDNNLHSPPVGRAQGFYFYNRKDYPTAWFAFSFYFNSTQHKGTLNFAGADPVLEKTRDISVLGGTGDFFMTRGVATFSTDTIEGSYYFRLRVDINLYECW